ncbi:OmpW/AlkL family protein [Faucicola boevrei]|uniref:OmpW/AlkL family protein n=1 Tax=Faucicola boevrei TaxID=346665 RepID=UPI000365AB59|nr:OmpW family outer membrane protein [Moraxella boevrei]
MKLHHIALASLAVFASSTALAVPAGTWTVGVGAAYVDPQSDASVLKNGASVTVDENTQPSLTFEYFPANNVGIEVLAALPFQHDINIGGNYAGKTQHLPPTVSLNYHFDGLHSKVKPFVGVGVNYTTFFKERLYTPSVDLELDDSVGAAGQVGVDFKISDRDAVRVNARYINIESDVKLNGADAGTVEINPWVYGVSYVKSF